MASPGRPAKKKNLTDPVAESQEIVEREEQEQEAKSLSIESLSFDDFQPIPVTAARQPHPFEGYPQTKIQIGTYLEKGKVVPLMISKTWIIALNPKEYVHQDPSGKGVSVTIKTKKNGVEHEEEFIVDYPTYHNRVARDQNGRSVDIVFDREIDMGNGKKMVRVAICPDHTARAQIAFTVDKKTGKVNVDRRYVLADIGQVSRLRKLFEMYHYQQTQSERLAQKFDAEPESTAQ